MSSVPSRSVTTWWFVAKILLLEVYRLDGPVTVLLMGLFCNTLWGMGVMIQLCNVEAW